MKTFFAIIGVLAIFLLVGILYIGGVSAEELNGTELEQFLSKQITKLSHEILFGSKN